MINLKKKKISKEMKKELEELIKPVHIWEEIQTR